MRAPLSFSEAVRQLLTRWRPGGAPGVRTANNRPPGEQPLEQPSTGLAAPSPIRLDRTRHTRRSAIKVLGGRARARTARRDGAGRFLPNEPMEQDMR